MGNNIRIISRKKWINRIDPVYILLDRVLFKKLFQPPKPKKGNGFEKLEIAEIDFLTENLKKHRIILWINIIVTIYLTFYGIDIILEYGNTSIVVTGLLAPAMITGTAWFSVSFGGIPEKFISIAFTLTLIMFLSFTLSMTLLTCLLIKITPITISVLIIIPIYLSLYISSMLFDNVDGLKIGLDSALLKFSKATINYYQKQGLITNEEIQKETYGKNTLFDSDTIALFIYYINNLERNINQLDENRTLHVANHSISIVNRFVI